MPLDYPVDDFFNDDELAIEAIYTNPSGVKSTILVIFDKESLLTPIGTIAVENAGPAAWAKTTDVSDATNACTLEISGTTYKIQEVKPDNTGLTLLTLAENRSWQ